nr:ATP synthase F0 subunit 8 [Opisthoplatia orientalis]
MMPISWLTLYIFFIMMFITFSLINYYSFIYMPINKKMKNYFKTMNWKW